MKKLFLMMAMVLSALNICAFEFDGIDLNKPYIKVTQEIAKRGYSYDVEKNCLKGVCQGTEIFLYVNYVDVKQEGQVGQLVVEIPMGEGQKTLKDVETIFNVVYHQVPGATGVTTYQVDNDGTKLAVSQKGASIFLTYTTPFYKAPVKK